MRIRTNTGIVELTAEMVTKGMTFKATRRFVVTENEGDGTVWIFDMVTTSNVGWDRFCDRERPTFLGCDPTIATRADCERYGVHDDAAAHGFAKLRDGGALDLRRKAPVGSVCYDADGRRFIVYDGPIERFGTRNLDTAKVRWFMSDESPLNPGSVERQIRDGDYGLPLRLYRRAIDPSSKVTPVRKQKTLSIRLPDDDDIGW